jgi:hypothetical protein
VDISSPQAEGWDAVLFGIVALAFDLRASGCAECAAAGPVGHAARDHCRSDRSTARQTDSPPAAPDMISTAVHRRGH